MSKPETNKQKEVTAATFKRLAKALRARARNHARATKDKTKLGLTVQAMFEQTRADIYTGIASDCDHEAKTLRGMR